MAVVQDAVAFELLYERPHAQLVDIEIPVPQEHVVNGAHQAAASDEVVAGGPVDQEVAVLARIVGCDPIRDNQRVVIEEERVFHP